MKSKLTRSLSWVPLRIALVLVASACAGAATPPASPVPRTTPMAAETSVSDKVYLSPAREAVDRGDYNAAITELDRAIAEYPVDANAYLMRGQAYEAEGEHDRAIADLDRAIQLEPGYAVAYYNRGLAYSAKGEHDRAIADLERASLLQPGYYEAALLDGAHARWRMQALPSYEMRMQWSSFHVAVSMDVEVQDGQVVYSKCDPIEGSWTGPWWDNRCVPYTVETLFVEAAKYVGSDDVRLEYDGQYGFPLTIWWSDPEELDSFWILQVTSLVPVLEP